MRWLDPQTLDAIYDAAVAADIVDRDTRTVLLQGVGDDVRLSLPDHARPDLQFRSDLRLLNMQPDGGSAPLRAWLAEAANLAEGRAAAQVFGEALARPDAVGEPGGPLDVPDTPEPAAVDPTPTPVEPPVERPPWLLPAIIGGGVAGVGLLLALALGGPDDAVDAGLPDATPADATPADVGRTPLRPLAVKLADASRGRPALYRVNPGTVQVEDVGGPRSVTVETALAWSRSPITAAQFRAVTGGLPAGRAADDTPIEGLSARALRTFCDALSRAEGLRPYYADGGDGYRLPPEDAWVFTCVGGRGGPPAPGAWGLDGFGAAEAVTAGDGRDAPLARRAGVGGIGIAACTAGRRVLGADAPAPAFRVVRPLSGEKERTPLGPLPR